MRKLLIPSLVAVLGLAAFVPLSYLAASSHFASLNPFTQSELDNNWVADREFPTGGVTSVTAFGRDEVAMLGINSDETDTNIFRRTEGIKTDVAENAIEVDLYVDPDWQDKAVRSGYWVVGEDAAGNRDNFFGILEFVNIEPSTSGGSTPGNHEGWRFWDSVNGWTNLTTDFTYGEWATLGIELDANNGVYNFYINGDLVGSGPGGANIIGEVFLNSYNYGEDEFPNLRNDSYSAHWHVGLEKPQSKNDCKGNGWKDYGFNNQGQCIRFVNTGQDSRY